MTKDKELVNAHISKLESLLIIAQSDNAKRTIKEIEEMISEAKKYEAIVPF